MSNIRETFREYDAAAQNQRDKGTDFENFVVRFLKECPPWSQLFGDVWMWKDWPGRGGRGDTGIDIVAKEANGEGVWAVQCKFFKEDYTVQKSDLDSFFTESGKKPFTHRLIVTSCNKWSTNAELSLQDQQIPVTRISLRDLEESVQGWDTADPAKITFKTSGPKKNLRSHQTEAIEAVVNGFETSDRGKVIMACGTGKTFTALKLAQRLVPAKGGITVFLAPSIALVSQSLTEWINEAGEPLTCYAVCSDVTVGKHRDDEDIRVYDLAYPATTSAKDLLKAYQARKNPDERVVIFSTYQSIQVLSEAQRQGLPEFDLVICDEAHRTTGFTAPGEDESAFVRVHDNEFIKAMRRLYMTATPRIYSDVAKARAQEISNRSEEGDGVLYSMDDSELFGPEFHRLGFGEAVEKGLLTDYKVLVLAVDEDGVSRAAQTQLTNSNGELTLEDPVKIVGCWNGLSYKFDADTATVAGQPGTEKTGRTDPDSGNSGADKSPPKELSGPPKYMGRAVAFCRTIKDSKKIANWFEGIVDAVSELPENKGKALLRCKAQHVDGTMGVLTRNVKLDWLRENQPDELECRILTNAKCLSEGVDVPALDAVMFLNARDSVVDIVQSLGRVMRKAPGKDYGYIIIPIGIPAGSTPERTLNSHKSYRVVWQVLQALRAHDERFNALINRISLNRDGGGKINIIGGGPIIDPPDTTPEPGGAKINLQLTLPEIEEWRQQIYAKIVKVCGQRDYWEEWARDIAKIHNAYTARLKTFVEKADDAKREEFDAFVGALRQAINPSVTEAEAIDILGQHALTRPIFNALFANYPFADQNPVSQALDRMLESLRDVSLESEMGSLDKFYASVARRAEGITTDEGRQRVVSELYEKFFRHAFPKAAESLGVVYTPVEIVDYILRSADWALQQEFGVGLGDRNVHVLDPFTGTGTFLVRLIELGIIPLGRLYDKYQHELHANDIMLLAYYIAAVNIEGAFHRVSGEEYRPFPGIVLADTFQMTEAGGNLTGIWSPENNERAAAQNKCPIRVIIGNPPYSVGQTSENDANKNLKYPALDKAIAGTYVKESGAGMSASIYDSYIRAIRWATDRLGEENGVICFVTNAGFLETNSADGLRKSLSKEFSAIHIFNLRGNQRTQGELSRREGGKIFGSGSRAPIAITLFVKNTAKAGPCQIFYRDIGDYLTREQKLALIAETGSAAHRGAEPIHPNDHGDWLNPRDETFQQFTAMKPTANEENSIFSLSSLGVSTNRDAWAYNFARAEVEKNMARMAGFYAQERIRADGRQLTKDSVETFVNNDPKLISWSRGLKDDLRLRKDRPYEATCVRLGSYRPFCKEWLYFSRAYNNVVYQIPRLFPTGATKNLVIAVTGTGISRDFSAIMTDATPNLHFEDSGQCFPLYWYEVPATPRRGQSGPSGALPFEGVPAETSRRDGITDWALNQFRTHYRDKTIGKEDIFYYTYAVLHNPRYKERYASDLKKTLPRIPFAADFWAYARAGRELAHWHLNYESVEPYPLTETTPSLTDAPNYAVQKMRFGRKDNGEDKRTIIYNSAITLSGIPLEAYGYVVNGRPAIEWVMDRYQVRTDRDSGIRNDPNLYSEDPRYILDLLKRIVRVSVESVRIIASLPDLGI